MDLDKSLVGKRVRNKRTGYKPDTGTVLEVLPDGTMGLWDERGILKISMDGQLGYTFAGASEFEVIE